MNGFWNIENSPTFRMLKKLPSFWNGFGSVLDIGGTSYRDLTRYEDMKPSEADYEALKADWEAVGQDFKAVMGDWTRGDE